MAIVYQHIRKDTHTIFNVGIGKEEKRAYSKNNRNKHWHNIVNKHGYYVEIIYGDLTWELACQMERYLIKEYGRNDLGLGTLINMTDGGEGGNNVSKESREKRSKSLKGRIISDEARKNMSKSAKIKIFTDKHRKNLSDSRKGEKNFWYGKNISEETKIKISLANTGKKWSDEQKQKLKEIKKNISDETRKKLSESGKGRIPWNKGIAAHNKGISMTKEQKQKLRKPKSTTINMKKPKKLIICPHCNLEGGSSNMTRYHFDNCKFKNNII